MIEIERDRLWTDYQPMRFLGVPIGRRCAVARSTAGELVVFSPLQATPETTAALRSLGRISAFVVPSLFHDRFYEDYFPLFPEAVFLANPAAMASHRAWPLQKLSADIPQLSGIRFVEMKGMPRLQEHVFLHEASRTLIVADAIFNLRKSDGWSHRFALLAAGIKETPGLCRLFRTLVRDRKALADSLETVLAWDFDRIVPGHGEVIETRAKDILAHAFRAYTA